MGIFDSLYVVCRCGEEVEFQSKADDDAYCRRFDLTNCPPVIAADLIGDSKDCQCGRTITIQGSVNIRAEASAVKTGDVKP